MGWSDSWSAVSLAESPGARMFGACGLAVFSTVVLGQRRAVRVLSRASQPPELKHSGVRRGAFHAQAAPNSCLARLLWSLIFGLSFKY